jgi:hypothetical protein
MYGLRCQVTRLQLRGIDAVGDILDHRNGVSARRFGGLCVPALSLNLGESAKEAPQKTPRSQGLCPLPANLLDYRTGGPICPNDLKLVRISA